MSRAVRRDYRGSRPDRGQVEDLGERDARRNLSRFHRIDRLFVAN
jgi:hypothetical protein